MGTVTADGEKLRFVTDQRSWKIANPKILQGHEGHYIRVKAHVYPEKDSIYITEVEDANCRREQKK